MSIHLSRWASASLLSALLLAAGAVAAFAVTAGLTIRANPRSFNPSAGQTVKVTYDNDIKVYSMRVYVKNHRGAVVRTLARYRMIGTGPWTKTWDGRNSSGDIVPAGNYRIVFSGKNADGDVLKPVATEVKVIKRNAHVPTQSEPTPSAPSNGAEKGQIIEGAGSSNWDWTKRPGYKMGIAFRSPKSGTLRQITLQWKKSSGYGAGSYGRYNFELQANGAGNLPSGRIIARANSVNPVSAMDGQIDGAFRVSLNASLTAGQIYHIVIYNVDPNPSRNWSSPNGLMTRVQPWDGTGNRTSYYSGGSWKPYSSRNNPWNTSGSNNVNGQYTATMLTWSDGTNTGDPYYSARLSQGAYFYGRNRAGQQIVWDGPSTTISRIGLSVKRKGNPGGPLLYHLEKVGGGEIAKGTLVSGGSRLNTGSQSWVYAALPSPVRLTQGATYRLWFESPGSSSSANSYYTAPVYGENRPAAWIANSWGGTRSHYIYGSGSLSSSMTTADLSFSLQ
ncbi:MAG: FlgD immunoglobulin-like domain containing protein [Armatimonadota bacterium]